MQNTHKRPLTKFYLVLLIFIVPMMMSWCMYYFRDQLQFKTMNHGALVNPPINAQHLIDAKQNKWWIVYVSEQTCDAQCEKIAYQLNQLRKTFGKNSERINVERLTGKRVQLNAEFEKHGEKDFSEINKIYLVDPQGNLFMYYPSDTNLMNVLKDLKRVLEVSQIG